MITNEVQYRATKAHLAKFEEAAANLEATLAKGGARARLTQLELDAVRAQADDLRAEIEETLARIWGELLGLERVGRSDAAA